MSVRFFFSQIVEIDFDPLYPMSKKTPNLMVILFFMVLWAI